MVRPLVPVRALRTTSLCVLFLACAALVRAQDAPPTADAQAPAHIALVDGVAVLERDGRTDDAPGNMPLLAGDRIRTRSGRVEVLFADGSTLHLDHNSAIDLQSDELVRIIEGRIRLSIPGPVRSISYRVDGPHGWAQITEPGDYRIALLNGPAGTELELAVIRGRAQLANDGGQTPLRAGERAFARAGAAPSYAYVANSAAFDAFDRWSEARRDERLTASAEYLPEEVRPYAASFERDGYWRDEPSYGRVWYPRVAADWRPYYRGRWVSLRPYGWTWVPYDPWGWPTHHYGRWGFSAGGSWFWIPGRTWGAAWVSWAHAPGYVSWCPLGWNNRAVFQINFNVGTHYDPWRAWTVIPQRHFGYGYVHRNVIRGGSLDHGIRASFSYRDRAPEIRGYAVPRAAAPIRVAGSGSYRRGTTLYTNLPADQGRIRTDGARVRVPGGSANAPVDRSSTGAVARERAVPTRPATRSQRPENSELQRSPVGLRSLEDRTADRSRAMRSDAVPGVDTPRPESAPRAVPRYEPRGGAPSSYDATPERRSASPRVTEIGPDDRRSASPRAVERAPYPSSRSEAAPAYRRPAEIQGAPAPSRDDRPESSYETRRAQPRVERPSGGLVAPQVERGPDRAPSGSYERRAPAAAQPSGGRPADRAVARPSAPAQAAPAQAAPSQTAPSQGARPRGRGGEIKNSELQNSELQC